MLGAACRMKRGVASRPGATVIRCAVLAVLVFPAHGALAESCLTASDLDNGTRTALTAAGLRYFDLVAKADTVALRQKATPSVASDFSVIETTVKDNQAVLGASMPAVRPPFLLVVEGTASIPRAEFYCGVFGSKGQTRDTAVFSLNDLSPGKYAVVVLDAPSSKSAHTVSLILQQEGSDWKLGGLYIQVLDLAGHNSNWFASRARDFQAKGQMHNAWLYFIEAISLVSPLPFMSTKASDDLYDESQKSQLADFPAEGKAVDLSAGTATYKLTSILPVIVGDDLDLLVKYQAADISNTNQAYQNNVAVMKALVAKFPELRTGFAAVVARAIDPSGRDYGAMLAMKEIK